MWNDLLPLLVFATVVILFSLAGEISAGISRMLSHRDKVRAIKKAQRGLVFPDRPVRPTKPLVFNDSELAKPLKRKAKPKAKKRK